MAAMWHFVAVTEFCHLLPCRSCLNVKELAFILAARHNFAVRLPLTGNGG
jgi:hypothetical protein